MGISSQMPVLMHAIVILVFHEYYVNCIISMYVLHPKFFNIYAALSIFNICKTVRIDFKKVNSNIFLNSVKNIEINNGCK